MMNVFWECGSHYKGDGQPSSKRQTCQPHQIDLSNHLLIHCPTPCSPYPPTPLLSNPYPTPVQPLPHPHPTHPSARFLFDPVVVLHSPFIAVVPVRWGKGDLLLACWGRRQVKEGGGREKVEGREETMGEERKDKDSHRQGQEVEIRWRGRDTES